MDAEQLLKRRRRLAVQANRSNIRRGGAVSDPLASVSRDATSNWYFPASVAQWNTLLTVAGTSGAPSVILLSQEASGDLADSSGNAVTFTASGTGISYQQTVTGFARKGISTTDGATGLFSSTNALLPDISATSCAVLSIGKINTEPGTFRNIHSIGTTTKVGSFVKNGPALQMFADANGSTAGPDPLGQVRIFITYINRTGSAEGLVTNQESQTCTFTGTPTGKSVAVVGGANAASDAVWMYHAVFSGTSAEKSVATWKTVMTTIGATVSF